MVEWYRTRVVLGGEEFPGSNLGKTPIMLTGFSWSKPALQGSTELLLRLGHDHVIPNLLLLIIKSRV